MEAGYLYVETSRTHPGLVRVLATTGVAPRTGGTQDDTADTAVRCIARFSDIDAARLHAFSALHRHMLDVDNGLFRVELVEAIAVVESVSLPHRRLYLDPSLDERQMAQLARLVERRQRRHVLTDRIWQAVGWAAAAWLALWALLGF